MNKIIKFILFLGITSCLVGFLAILSISNTITKPPSVNDVGGVVLTQNPQKLSSSLQAIGLTPHNPILINQDSDFASQASTELWLGDGSPENPYIIQNYMIGNSSISTAIYIINTTVSFIIQNVWIDSTLETGILLNNVENSLIFNNTISNTGSHGIYLLESNSNIFDHNILVDNFLGFYVSDVLSGNEFVSNSVKDNVYGFYLYNASNNVFHSNFVSNNQQAGFFIDQSLKNSLSSNIVQNNSYAGIELSTFSKNNSIVDNLIQNNNYGIVDEYTSQSNYYASNIVTFNFWGVFLTTNSQSHTFTNNSVSNNYIGFNISSSHRNLITFNNITDNSYGIYISFDVTNEFNRILWNDLSNNLIYDSFDDSRSTNTWFANVYSNYSGELFIVIPGITRAVDLNPQYSSKDSDNDGMPDWFELKYGLNTLENDSNDDNDNDGLSNIEEFRNGRDPTKADSLIFTETTTDTNEKTSTQENSSSNTIFGFTVIFLFVGVSSLYLVGKIRKK